MARFLLRAAPLLLALAMGSISCSPTTAGTTGCGLPTECGPGTYWNGSQCESKDALCGQGTKYDAARDACVRTG